MTDIIMFIAAFVIVYFCLSILGVNTKVENVILNFRYKTPYLHKCRSRHNKGTWEEIVDPDTGERAVYNFSWCDFCDRDIYRKLTPKDGSLLRNLKDHETCMLENPESITNWKPITQEINKVRYAALAAKPDNYKADIIAERRKTTY